MENRFHILLVEDSDADAELVLRTLRDQRIPVARVRDGVEAVEYIFCERSFAGRERTLPDLVLLDVKMPRVDGMELLQTLKSDALTQDIPVIMLTTSASRADMAMSRAMGAVGFLEKPQESAEFSALIVSTVDAWMKDRQSRA